MKDIIQIKCKSGQSLNQALEKQRQLQHYLTTGKKLKKYRVKYCVEEIYYTDVEATTEKEALDKAHIIADNGELENENENLGMDFLSIEEINKTGV